MKAIVKMVGQEGVQNMLFPSWQTGPRLGAAGMLAAYSTMPWLRAYLQKISEDVASLTWQVYVPTNAQGKAIRDIRLQRSATFKARTEMMRAYAKAERLREIPNHPALDLITGGNDWFAGIVSMQVTQAHLDLIGELAWILETNQFNMPVQSVPIPPTWIMQLPQETGGVYRVVGPGSTWEVPENKMFFTYHPNPANPFRRGTGIGQVLADELETDEYAAKYTKDWFRNRAIPPVLISGLGVGLPELQRLEEKWLGKFQRKGAGWLPHFIGSKVDVHQLSQSFQQQELGELRKNERDTIRQVIGIPPEIMGDVSNSNRSTIDVSDFIYQSRVIVPRAEFLRASMQARLMPLFDERLVIDYLSPINEDREFALKVRTAYPYGWDVDEWRELGLSGPLPMNKGKVRAVPFNITFSNELTPLPIAPETPPVPAPPPLPPAPIPTTPPTTNALPARAGRVRAAVAALPPAIEKTIDNHAIAAAVAAITPQVLERAGLPVLRAAIAHFGQLAIDDAGPAVEIAFDEADPRVTDYLRIWGAERMGDLVNETTKTKIGNALADGVDAGETFDELVGRVQDVFEGASEARAANIAATELTAGTSFAAEVGLRQAGFEEKEWLSTQDDKVRDTHKAGPGGLDGTVVGIDEDFQSSSGASGPYPGAMGDPAEDCECRCTIITVLAARSLAARTAQYKTIAAERAPFEKRMREAMAHAFKSQEQAVLAVLEEHRPGAAARRQSRQILALTGQVEALVRALDEKGEPRS